MVEEEEEEALRKVVAMPRASILVKDFSIEKVGMILLEGWIDRMRRILRRIGPTGRHGPR